MITLILAVILLVASIVLAIAKVKGVPAIAFVLAIIFTLVSCFAFVPTGHTGIPVTLGKVGKTTLEAGPHIKSPLQNIVTMDNREQKIPFQIIAFSSDIQQVQASGSVNYAINQQTAMDLYREVGTRYVDILISPRLLEDTKAVFSVYAAEELISSRETLSNEVRAMMVEDLSGYGIDIKTVAIEDIDFTDAFTNAVEAKQVATQEKLRAQTQQEQRTMEAQAEAQRKKIAAESEAEVARINADAAAYETRTRADAEAEANKKIAESLNEKLIEYEYVSAWDGMLPSTYLGSDSALPIINAAP